MWGGQAIRSLNSRTACPPHLHVFLCGLFCGSALWSALDKLPLAKLRRQFVQRSKGVQAISNIEITKSNIRNLLNKKMKIASTQGSL